MNGATARTTALILALLPILGTSSATLAESKRPFTIEDFLRTELLGRSAISPDGRFLVYEWIPPVVDAPNLGAFAGTLAAEVSAKLYVVDLDDPGKPQPLFEQLPHGSYWQGGFSPDGERLAIYSLVDGRIRAGVFDFANRKATWFAFTPNYAYDTRYPTWLSSSELLYPVLPPGELTDYSGGRIWRVAQIGALWQKAFEGAEPTATVLRSESSGVAQASSFRVGTLVRADTRTGQSTALADGQFSYLRLSPTARYVAALKEGGVIQPGERIQAHGDLKRYQLAVIDLDARAQARQRIPCPHCDVSRGSMLWSADGEWLVFAARPVGSGADAVTLYRYTLETAALERIELPGFPLTSCGFVGYGSGHLHMVVLGSSVVVCARPEDPQAAWGLGPPDWFLIDAAGSPVNLTAGLRDVSDELIAVESDALFVYADGVVWRVGLDGRKRNLTESFGAVTPWWRALADYAAPWYPSFRGASQANRRTVLESPDEVLALDLQSGAATRLAKPNTAALVNVAADGRTAVFRRDHAGQSTLLVVHGASPPRAVKTINRHLAGVAGARQVELEHAVQGQSVSSCVLLPPDWTPGRRYPVIVNVYPYLDRGACYGSQLGTPPSAVNLQLMAARGYVVLFPATPRALLVTPEGPTKGLTAVVLAAVDHLIQLGYADPDRIGLIGISQGNQAALQVLTETTRFRAAVVGWGIANGTSAYGQMTLSNRLDLSDMNPGLIGEWSRWESEAIPFGTPNALGVKLWEDPERYTANSPVFFADRIETPVMLLHSDLDEFPLGQSEEMFSALYRLRKEATYVTYWGEGHGVTSPANVRDMWQRIFAWYDEHLRAGESH